MKIWQAFSAEHSAMIKIIGRFDTLDDAKQASTLFNRLVEISNSFRSEESASIGAAVVRACADTGLSNFSASDTEQLRSFRAITAGGREIRVEADHIEIQALLKVMAHFGARIEIYSRRAPD